MKRNYILFGTVLSLLAASACTETADLVEVERKVSVVQTENFPTVPVIVDTTLVLRVYYQATNGCGRFSRVDSATTPAGIKPQISTITLYARYPEEGQDVVCTSKAKSSPFTINYKPTAVGKHIFRFWKSDTEFISDTVEVKAR